MLSKLPKITLSKYRIFFIVLCVIGLIGYSQPAINVHVSFFDMTYSTSFGLTAAFGDTENPLDMLGLGESDISAIIAEVDMMEHFGYVRGRIVAAAVLYLLVIILLLVILGLSLFDKLKPVKAAILALSLALYIIVGSAVLSVPEIIIDILTGAVEDILGYFAALIDISNLIYAELGTGYWITLLALAGMLVMEAAIFLKGKISIP